MARIGPEAVVGTNLEPGDRIQVEYLVGQAVRVTRVVPLPFLDPDRPQLDPRVRRLAGARRRLDRVDGRHPVDDAAERGVDARRAPATAPCR